MNIMTYDQIIGRLRVLRQQEMQRGSAGKVQQFRIDEISNLIDDVRDFQDRQTNGKTLISYDKEELQEVMAGYLGEDLILVHPNRPAVRIKEVEYAFDRYDKVSNETVYKIIKNRQAA